MRLLATLGSSFAVVPEAYLMGNGDACYDEVFVIATSDIEKSVSSCREWFAEHAPQTALHIFTIDGLPDIRNFEDHIRYEEALFRLYAHLFLTCGRDAIHLCLAGGFKTISSSAHQCADLFGCAKLFHITAPSKHPGYSKPAEIFAVIEADLNERRLHPFLHLIDLGPRPGWPTLQELLARAPALPDIAKGEAFVIQDTKFREAVMNRLAAANNLAASESKLASLPFPQLARWSPGERAALEKPVEVERDRDWVLSLPKVELHCHLGGFATHCELLRQVRAAASDPDLLPPLNEPPLPADWPLPEKPIGLSAYFPLGNATGSELLKDPGCLRKQCELLYRHLQEQNIVYAEIRCSPANYADPKRGRSPWDVLHDIKATFDACMEGTVGTGIPPDPTVPTGVPPVGFPPKLFLPYNGKSSHHQTWRDLPHRHQAHATAFVTFRLADSIPAAQASELKRERDEFLASHPKPWDETTWQGYCRQFPERVEQWLDQAHGSCLLRDPANAEIVVEALRHFDGDRYILDEFVIMPNHVHVLVKPLAGYDLSDIHHSWKSFTAKKINARMGTSGRLWQDESFDKLVRSGRQLDAIRCDLRQKPEKAGLESGFVVGKGSGLVLRDERVEEREAENGAGGTPAPTVNLIIIATRRKEETGDYRAAISRHLALAITAAETWTRDNECRVVGVDLAGYEDKTTRAHYFREEFTGVHRCGLALTVHAGENDDAEGIWRAVFDLNARRLGHALSLEKSPELMRSIAARGIAVEMCPYANYQIKGFDPMPDRPAYPLKNYLAAGIPVTVNTDNIGISAASLTENLLLAARMCPRLTRLDLLTLIRHAIDTAFLTPPQRQHLLATIHIPPPHSGDRHPA